MMGTVGEEGRSVIYENTFEVCFFLCNFLSVLALLFPSFPSHCADRSEHLSNRHVCPLNHFVVGIILKR